MADEKDRNRHSHQKPAKAVGIVTVETDSPALLESGLMYHQQPTGCSGFATAS